MTIFLATQVDYNLQKNSFNDVFSFLFLDCDSQCSEEALPTPIEIAPPPHVLTITGSLVPVQKSSPERRNQKEIVAGEERPKFLTTPPKTEENAQGMREIDQHKYIHLLFLCVLWNFAEHYFVAITNGIWMRLREVHEYTITHAFVVKITHLILRM